VLLNWEAITTTASLSVGFTTVQAPLGVTLLASSALVVAALVALVAYQRAAALVEARRFARELRAQRELADQAEASRFTELRSYLQGELQRLRDEIATGRSEANGRADRLEQALAARVTETANGLSAHLGELEDKVDRMPGWRGAAQAADARSP
jgi:biopolymer transport protein ExbB/TolQ